MKKESSNEPQRAAMMGGKREAGAIVSTDTSVVTVREGMDMWHSTCQPQEVKL